MTDGKWIMWGVMLACLAGFAQAAGNAPSPDTRAGLLAEVTAVEDANLLTVRWNGQTGRVQLAGVQRTGFEAKLEAGGHAEEKEPEVCQLGNTACALSCEPDDPRQPQVRSYRNRRARAALEGLVAGRRIRVEFLDPGSAEEPRLALIFRVEDGLFVNHALVRQGFALAAEQPAFESLEELRQAQARAQAEKAGLWGAPLPQESQPEIAPLSICAISL